MLAWLRGLRRARVLPSEPVAPVRVNFVARVVSPNVVRSPLTGLTAALIQLSLLDYEMIQSNTRVGDSTTGERFIPLGSVVYGEELAVVDERGTALVIQAAHIKRLVPLNPDGLPLDRSLPNEFAPFARQSQHLLAYQESLLRKDDRVRIVGSVQQGDTVTQAGYRDAVARQLVASNVEPLILHEML